VNILVTGGAGYIGSVLVPSLMGAGHNVVVIDNFMYGQQSLNHLCADDHFGVVNGDARDMRVVRPFIPWLDLFIPLAAIVGAPACERDYSAASTTNFLAIKDTLELLSKEQSVIYPTTNSGYGIGRKEQDKHVPCTEEDELKPLSHYATSKVDAEKVVGEHMNSVSFRLATVFGMSPRMRLDLLVNDFVHRALTDKSITLFEPRAKRNFLHIRDVVSAFKYAIENFGSMRSMAFNVGLSDANLDKIELCERIREHVPGFRFTEGASTTDPDKRDYVVSNAKIESHGFKPQCSLDVGIRELVKGLKMLGRSRYGNV
jgi:nucleoside-diphosphate-sugar epimerase